jgi:lipopolysaccharide export system protein LptA
MTKWLRRARLAIGVFVIVFAIALTFAFRRRTPPVAAPVVHTEPGAVVESLAGHIVRFSSAREDVSIDYERQLTYSDGSTKMINVKVVSVEKSGSRTFTITGQNGQLEQNESVMRLDGDVRLAASDGLTARTEHASYTQNDGMVRAAGPVTFARARLTGSGIGMTYDKNLDALAILDQAIVRVAPDAQGGGGLDISSGAATFARRDHVVRFERSMHVQRADQVIDADNGVALLTPDSNHVESIDLHGTARITASTPAAGGLQALTGDAMTLKYAGTGDVLQHVLITGSSVLKLAGEAGKPGREITAQTIDITLAPDGSTPIALSGHENVLLTFPADAGTAARTVHADDLHAKGDASHGLTHAQFTGVVDYREHGPDVNRAAKSEVLDVVLTPGMGEIDDAKFSRHVRFEEGSMAATAAEARYLVGKGTLELSGTDAASRTPHVVNEQIKIDATHIDVTLAGPKMKAAGSVKSELQPPKQDAPGGGKLPSMLKQDQPVNVTANALDYDGTASRATYTGAAQLWQSDTSVKGASITIDDKTGDLSATGPVTTTTMLEQTNDDTKKKERVRSIATAGAFKYDDAQRRATYTGDAHMSGPQGDMTAAKIELYLKPSGDEVERAESHDDANTMTLREQSRTTTGVHLTYTAADEQYVVTGRPVKIVDQCGRETTGGTLIFHKATDSIVVDGKGFRTQTKGGGACPQ